VVAASGGQSSGLRLVSGGTDNHLCLIDLRPMGLTGDVVTDALEHAGITCNKNMVPFDTQPPQKTSGVRVGSAAGTTRGFGVAEFTQIGHWIAEVAQAVKTGNEAKTTARIRQEVSAMCQKYPIYPTL
jgi:glycine hydroxymethyltransferase